MTDTPSPRKSFENGIVWLPEVALAAMRSGQPILDGYTFTNCLISGPAVIAVVEGVQFNKCDFGPTTEINDLFLQPLTSRVTGAIGISNSVFEGCRFEAVGLTGNPDFMKQAPQGISITGTPQ